jgi:ATP-dependent exoDNAse (exonuclease V) alpha subunit
MIAKAAPKRRSGRGSFSDLRQYLTVDDRGINRDDLVASWSGNVASDATADIEMEHVAALGKTSDPVYHVILSWRPQEEVTPQVARAAVDATLRSLSAEDHQWFAAFHRDESDGRMHLHMGINKTHPITLKALDRYQDFAKLARACEFVEAEYGCKADRRMDWRKKLPEVELGLTLNATRQYVERLPPVGLSVAPEGANTAEMDAARRAGYSWVALVAKDAAPAARKAAKRDGATWQDVHAALETYGVHFELAGSGLRVIGPEIGQHVKGSRVGVSFKGLEQKLGPYEAASYRVPSLPNRLAEAKVVLRRATSWTEIHRDLGAIGFAVERRSRGGRLSDLANGAQGVPLGRVGTSMPRLEERFGPYVETTAIDVRNDREQQRRREGVAERIAAVAEHPEILVERISAHHSIWTETEVEYALARVVGIDRKELVDDYGREAAAVTAAVTDASYVLYQDDQQTWLTTNAIRDDERAMIEAFDGVALRRRDLAIGPAAADLDAQQRRAYYHLNSGESDLRIVTGIGGAGKSRLLRSACAANAAAGYRFHGVAVAGSAALVLGEEAGINARTVARFLIDVEQGHEKLGRSDVVVVDEVSTLGNDDAVRLAGAVNKAGARLWLLGDVAQHETVARGPVLPELLERYEVEDLSVTRRAEEQWLRDVGTDLRAGRTARALDTLRDRGAIGEYETAGDAKASLVKSYATDVRNGESALLIATRTADVDDLNRLAREQLRDRLGMERTYSTGFGTRAFAIGETVVTREPDSASRSVNGDVWKVAGHLNDGRLELARERDGATVRWDVRDKPLIDYGYAVTSFRSQGRTVDGSYVLATQADAQRGLYVDVTRARKRVAIAYGRSDLHDFGRLLDVGARERAKLTIAGLERYLADTRRQTARELTMAAPGPTAGPTTSGAPPRAAAAGPEPRNVTPQNPGQRTPAELRRMQAAAAAFIAAEAARGEARSAEMVRNYERETPTTIKNVTPSVPGRVAPPTPTVPPVPQPAMSPGHFRISENAKIPNDWGRFADAREFAEHLKTTPIGRVWRVELAETGDSVSLKNFFTSIKDSGHSISVKGKAERDVTAAVELAAAKGWKSVHVDSSEESRLSVALAAAKRGINVEGIAKELLAKAQSIAAAVKPKPGWKQ